MGVLRVPREKEQQRPLFGNGTPNHASCRVILLVGLAGGEACQHGRVQAAWVVETVCIRRGAAQVFATVRRCLRGHFLCCAKRANVSTPTRASSV